MHSNGAAPADDSSEARNLEKQVRNLKLILSYDGSEFAGWQVQPGLATVQGTLASAIGRLSGENVLPQGSGRTDAGVHALGQVASFRAQSGLSAEEFQRALNALLPPTIRIVGSEEVGPDFHARWSAYQKTYRYRLYRGKVVPPALWRFVLHYPFPLNEDAMRDAAARFVGTHDFASFAASTGSEDDDKERTTEREIYATDLSRTPDNEELVFTVTGRSFLRYMVRKMVGTLLDVGRGKLTPADIERLYELKDRSKSGPTVPPQGLVMVEVQHLEAWRVGRP